ncbi:hypothetical protein [Butyrivibrio sp. FCS014]|uniref:hypothetical protein n=1 Tax=Butyrivibrio sp. FCS014 TaxID=1408304 RepID=UPI0004633BA6|nr:hypothetical protein [Butyrivibrio sp. FCS014]
MKKKKMTSYDVLHVGNDYYYISNEFNMLIRSTVDNKCEIIGCIPDERLNAESLVSQMLHINNTIVMIPLNAKKIWIFDIDNRNWHGIRIDDEDCKYKFMRAIRKGSKLYLLPSKYRRVIILNILTYEIKYIDIEDKTKGICNSTFFRADVVCFDHMLYAAYCGGDYVLAFDMTRETYEWKKVGANCDGYSGIAWDGKKFWLLPRKDEKRVVLWDGKTLMGKVEIHTSNGGINRGIIAVQNKVYVNRDNETIVIDCDKAKDEGEREPAYFFYNIIDNKIHYLRYNNEYTWIKDGLRHTDLLELHEEAIKNFAVKNDSNSVIDGEVVCENELFGISDFLSFVSNK